MNMIEAPLNNANEEEEFMYALVPLRSCFLCQASLFDERTYPLPKVTPGEAAVIVDSDQRQDNFKRGIVTAFSYETGLHTIQIDSIETLDCYGREIRNDLQSSFSTESIISPRKRIANWRIARKQPTRSLLCTAEMQYKTSPYRPCSRSCSAILDFIRG